MRSTLILMLFALMVTPATAQQPTATNDDHQNPKESQEQPLDFWMQKKLDYSGAILQGLTTDDFGLIEENARKMRLLNKLEGFARNRHPEYRINVRVFERITDEVIKQAKKKNTEGVTLAFHQLTTSCVRCHQSLREQASEPAKPNAGEKNQAERLPSAIPTP
ncbi:MAG: hypothetical protein WBD20_27605 [Pirellulaceae bacterium]